MPDPRLPVEEEKKGGIEDVAQNGRMDLTDEQLKEVQCENCKEFIINYFMPDHMCAESAFKCALCGISMPDAQSLSDHIIVHEMHENEINSENEPRRMERREHSHHGHNCQCFALNRQHSWLE